MRYALIAAAVLGACVWYVHERDLAARFDAKQASDAEVRATDAHLKAQRSERAAARERVEGLDSDPVEVEAAIRRNKGLIRPGERVFLFQEDAASPGVESPAPDR